MILLGINSNNEYKLFEGDIKNAPTDYNWIESFETMGEAKSVLNAKILDIPVESYELLKHLDKNKETGDFIERLFGLHKKRNQIPYLKKIFKKAGIL